MIKIATWISRTVIATVLATVAFVAVASAAYALPSTEPSAIAAPPSERLETAWQREQAVYTRMGRLFDNADAITSNAQQLIDRASANGKDVSVVQAALDALTAAIKDARPTYESARGIVASHQGFDANGKVTDATRALSTVQAMHSKLRDVRLAVMPSARALRVAVRAFRQANHPTATPTP